MNILQVIPYFTFARGGDVAVCYNLACEFTNKGHNVTILTTNFEYNPEDTGSISNLSMIPVDYKFNLSLFIYSPGMKRWLDENISKYDIIHLHELRSYQNNLIMKYARKYDIPYIIQPHTSTPTHVGSTYFKKIYDVFYGKRLMRNSSGVIAVSEYEARYDRLMRDDNIDVIYNGMNLDEFKNVNTKHYDKIDSPYILYFGRLDKLKGIDYIIHSFAQLPDEFDKYKLVIAGKISDYKKELEILVSKYNLEDRVIFTGFIKQEDKIAIYKDASLFVNPVKYMGGVSITTFESILAGTPVIVTMQSGELVKKMDAGIIVEYADVKGLRDAMIKSLTNKQLTKRQVENGQKYIYNNLSWSDVADRTLKVYEKYIKK